MKAFCAWAVVLPLWPCLAEECSDTVGSCSAKQASLMQFKSMSQKKQALSLEAQTSFSSKLAGFQKFTDEMVEKYGQPEEEGASAEPTPDVLQAVWTVLDFIEQMHSHLSTAHDDDEFEASGCEDTEAACKTSYMNPVIMTEILRLKAAAESKKQDHTSCRINATGPCQQICETNGLCAIYDAGRMTDEAKLPACVKNPESAFSDDNIKAAEDSLELKAMETCLDKTKTWLDFLYPKYDNCTRVESECEAKVLQCDKTQTKFQEAQCLYALDSNLRCQQFKQCKDAQELDCATKCTNIEMRSGARAADDETGQRLVCLLHTLFGEPDPSPSALKALFADETVPAINKSHFFPRPNASSRPGRLELCKNQDINTSQWTVTCPLESSSPAHEAGDVTQYSCPTEDVSSPCGVGFALEYSGFASVVNNEEGSCSDLARRGAQQVVDSCDNAGACIGSSVHTDHIETRGMCSAGLISFKGACCPSKCGKCGGEGCSGRPGGKHECCQQYILKGDKECIKDTDVACRLHGYEYTAEVSIDTQGMCSAGLITNKGACCPLKCGKCGGEGCSGRPGGKHECCQQNILKGDKECIKDTDVACYLPGYESTAADNND